MIKEKSFRECLDEATIIIDPTTGKKKLRFVMKIPKAYRKLLKESSQETLRKAAKAVFGELARTKIKKTDNENYIDHTKDASGT